VGVKGRGGGAGARRGGGAGARRGGGGGREGAAAVGERAPHGSWEAQVCARGCSRIRFAWDFSSQGYKGHSSSRDVLKRVQKRVFGKKMRRSVTFS